MIDNRINPESKTPFTYLESDPFEDSIEEQLEIDTTLDKLSSRKLWQILHLSQVAQCELDDTFIQEVQKELMLRNDFDEAWQLPH